MTLLSRPANCYRSLCTAAKNGTVRAAVAPGGGHAPQFVFSAGANVSGMTSLPGRAAL